MTKKFLVIGLMSGTSFDGIDIVLIETDGESFVKFIASDSFEYEDNFREDLRRCLKDYKNYPNNDKNLSNEIEHQSTILHANAVKKFLKKNNILPSQIDIIGYHGQTTFHRPDDNITVQLGDGKLLSELTKISVVNDLRTNDVKSGGQGAPLVPIYHYAITTNLEKPLALINIGGISNITYIDKEIEDLIAFDTGMGNALIDDYVLKHFHQNYDDGGKIATSGKVNQEVLSELLDNPYFSEVPPKSLDRLDFDSYLSKIDNLKPSDAVATLTEFTVQGIIKAFKFLPEKPKNLVICGGGRKNNYILQRLADVSKLHVRDIDDLEFNGDSIEAEAMAYLAVRSLKKLPITFPNTTGVKEPLGGGVFHEAVQVSVSK